MTTIETRHPKVASESDTTECSAMLRIAIALERIAESLENPRERPAVGSLATEFTNHFNRISEMLPEGFVFRKGKYYANRTDEELERFHVIHIDRMRGMLRQMRSVISLEDVCNLPGIGPRSASKIIEAAKTHS